MLSNAANASVPQSNKPPPHLAMDHTHIFLLVQKGQRNHDSRTTSGNEALSNSSPSIHIDATAGGQKGAYTSFELASRSRDRSSKCYHLVPKNANIGDLLSNHPCAPCMIIWTLWFWGWTIPHGNKVGAGYSFEAILMEGFC